MLTFKQYLSTFEKKFVYINFTEETNALLMEYAISNGFDLGMKYNGDVQSPSDFRFHTTIFYTSNAHNTPTETIKVDPFRVIPSHLELLGENHDVPVIKLKMGGMLSKIRKSFEDQGYKDTWGEYKPHITLSYNRKPYKLAAISLPKFPIVVSCFSIENQ